MNMQDKEFDNLFRSNLEGFETEPSANVWQNLDAGLQAARRRRILMPLLSAAASIVVLVAAGALFIPRHRHNAAQHPADHHIARINTPAKTPVAKPVTQVTQVAQANPVVKSNPAKQTVSLKTSKKQPLTPQPQINNATVPQQSVVNQPTQQIVAVLPDKHDQPDQPKKVDSALLAANTVAQPDVKPIEAVIPDKPVIAKTAPSAKKHRIHNLGDMLNTVIAAVDKRKDKLIEFSDADDDDSVITGVNLGIIAVKKQN